MREVQLYISDQRVELFKDESISLTDSIQNIRDPKKIFTSFSKRFTVPATKENNKIFMHYYNYDIVDGFDARQKVSAEIKLNYVTYKLGYIQLDGVNMKNNAPSSYKITFFGQTVSLKDLFGEDTLSALNWLDNFVLTYSSSNIKTYLGSGYSPTVDSVTYTDAVLVPLISHTDRMYYNSGSGHLTDVDWETNLYFDSDTGANSHGILWSNLKYSIRLHLIILAIQERYGITFSTDFFSSSNADYYDLYVWMHRKKGDVQSTATGSTLYTKLVEPWTTKTVITGITSGGSEIISTIGSTVLSTVTTTTTSTDAYNVVIRKDGVIYHTETGLVGSTGFDVDIVAGTYTMTLESTVSVSFSNINWAFDNKGTTGDTDASSITVATSFNFYPTQQLTEIKVIDFLAGVFKMFNLTAYVEDGTIVVDTLDNFYATYNTYDISEYVDYESSEVSISLPYKQIDFVYEDYKTYLAAIFNQLNNQEFGELNYKGADDQNWVGGVYKVNLPFQKMLYERLNDENGGTQTDIMYGWVVDDNQDPYIGKPLVHYVNRQTGATQLSFRDSVTSRSQLTNYYIPTNADGVTGSDQSLNFNAEIDEYALTVNTQTLFANYYTTYIADVFNSKQRLISLTAYLPLNILLNYNLSDRFLVNGKLYKINSIDTEMQSGKSKIELINEI